MSDIKLFRLNGGTVTELDGQSVAVERSLQQLLEQSLESFLGVRFLASEYQTGKTHGGRLDTLGIDENNCPVIIEYKRAKNQTVINQGLFYLDWLLDHRGEFELLVLKKFGSEAAANIDWSSPRLLCIAGDFTKYDAHAVGQIERNIELIRYRRYGEDLLLLEMVTSNASDDSTLPSSSGDSLGPSKQSEQSQSIDDQYRKAPDSLKALFEELKQSAQELGDDVQVKKCRWYYAFRRLRNFARVEIHPQQKLLRVFVRVGEPDAPETKLTVSSKPELDTALTYLERAYEGS